MSSSFFSASWSICFFVFMDALKSQAKVSALTISHNLVCVCVCVLFMFSYNNETSAILCDYPMGSPVSASFQSFVVCVGISTRSRWRSIW